MIGWEIEFLEIRYVITNDLTDCHERQQDFDCIWRFFAGCNF